MDQEDEKSDISLARRFANLFRFINDLNALNDGGEFEWSFKRIFLLNLYSRRKSNKKISFLDLLIKNERKKKKKQLSSGAVTKKMTFLFILQQCTT